MRLMIVPALMVFALTGTSTVPPPAQSVPRSARERRPPPGVQLGDLSWPAAEERLGSNTVVLLPLGAGALEHGRHLPLDTDRRLAEYLTSRVLEIADVVAAPALSYHFYPGFDEYPGSTSLSLNTARDAAAEIVRALARFGPRRYYVLNTGITTTEALSETAAMLQHEGVLLRYTDLRAHVAATGRTLQRQPAGAHADEIETSMMLAIDPASVDMDRATREITPEPRPFRLSRRAAGRAAYSPSGVWGDATLATREKGVAAIEALVSAIRHDIDDLRGTPLPVAGGATRAPGPGGRGNFPGDQRGPDQCLEGDDRTIRAIGPAFSLAWTNQDALAISRLWDANGDMVHPDGYIERSAQTILENRAHLFARPEYRTSRHPLTIGRIRCLTGDIAVADGKWELTGVTDADGRPVGTTEGLCTLVVRKNGGRWAIEAYRYSIGRSSGPQQPTVLSRPGYPGIK